MSLWQRLVQIDRRIIYIILVIVTVVPMIRPLGLPIPISKDTRQFYDGMKAAPDGSVVVIDWEVRFGRPTWNMLLEDVFKHLLTKNVKIINVSFDRSLEGGEVNEIVTRKIDPEKSFGKKYGIDYVNLGAVPGEIASLAGFVKDAWSVYPTDNRGTPVAQLPIMQYMKTGADIDYVVCIGSGVQIWWIGQLQQTYGTPIYSLADAGEATAIRPFLQSGQVKALLVDLQGAAEYEVLTGMPGEGLKGMDPMNTIHLTQAALLVFANIVFLMSRISKKEPAKEAVKA